MKQAKKDKIKKSALYTATAFAALQATVISTIILLYVLKVI